MSTIVDAANCTVAQAAGGAWLVTKTGGTAGAPDASAVSAEAIAGDFVLRMRVVGTGNAYAGVSAAPLAGHDFATIDRAVQLGGALTRIYESGVSRPPSFALAGFGWIRRTGTLLEYLTGSQLATAAVKRTVSGVGGALRFDSSLLAAGTTLEVKFGPPAAFAARPRRSRLSVALGL